MRTSALIVLPAVVSAFVVNPLPPAAATLGVMRSDLGAHRMGLFDGFAKAFANDDTLGERENAGLKKGATFKSVTWLGPNGQKKQVCCYSSDRTRQRPHAMTATAPASAGTSCSRAEPSGNCAWLGNPDPIRLQRGHLQDLRGDGGWQPHAHLRGEDAQQRRPDQVQHPKVRRSGGQSAVRQSQE
jgi:hypothetical protein